MRSQLHTTQYSFLLIKPPQQKKFLSLYREPLSPQESFFPSFFPRLTGTTTQNPLTHTFFSPSSFNLPPFLNSLPYDIYSTPYSNYQPLFSLNFTFSKPNLVCFLPYAFYGTFYTTKQVNTFLFSSL